MNRGATWGKWDLHIHTPASYEWAGKRLRNAANDAEREELLEDVVLAINASGCVAVAVMDYWTFDGINALRRYLKKPGATACNATIFPGIELRMVSPGDFRLNMHVVLNPELSEEQLNSFKSQLKLAQSGKPLADDYLIEYARTIGEDALIAAGSSLAAVQNDSLAALMAASKIAEVTPESVIHALKIFGEHNAVLFVPFDTNDGVKKINFREHYNFPHELLAMEAIFEVANTGTRDAFLGIHTKENDAYFEKFSKAIKHPKLAVRGSDAHTLAGYGKFPGEKPTWIKAKPTFAGLLQACKEPANRSFVGDIPPKIAFVAKHPHLFIKGVRIRKRDAAPEVGRWFDGTNLDFSSDLVALIGRKGSGKSALADVLGVLGDTPNESYLSFLSDRRFRLPKDNKASSFEAQLHWEQDSKDPQWRTLSNPRPPSSVQRVKYLPQRYFEELCNDHVQGDDRLFQDELRAVIFSHISNDERGTASSLDELIRSRSEVIDKEMAAKRATLKDVNARAVALAEQVDNDSWLRVRESIRLSLVQLKALRANRPESREAPTSEDAMSVTAAARVDELNTSLQKLEERRAAAQAEVDILRARMRVIEDIGLRLSSLERTIQGERATLEPRLAVVDLKWEDIFSAAINRQLLNAKREEATTRLGELLVLLDPTNEQSIVVEFGSVQMEISAEKAKLDEPMRLHQERLAAQQAWQNEWIEAVGSDESEDSFRGLWARMRKFPARRTEHAQLMAQRYTIAIEILELLHKRSQVLTELYEPVQTLLDEQPDIKDKLGVTFSVLFTFDSFAIRLFDYIKQSAGSFVGLEESKALAESLTARHDLSTAAGLRGFLSDVEEALSRDVRSGSRGKAVAANSLLRNERTLPELYDFLYGLHYAELSYGLMLGGVELERLSPGQRGALLLIFYLLVDRERIPIVLDQPEENLDNETVYELLVNVVTRAKQHRQVIMVTHSANLAVACDAEQVVVCAMDRDDGPNSITYTSGSIEELGLNRAIVDILEGTRPAFENRRRKYY